MAAIDFPTSPSVNETYTINGKTWMWDGTCWIANLVTVNKDVGIGTSAPSSPSVGMLWWKSDEGSLKIYYDDGSSKQWVDALGPTANSGSLVLLEEHVASSSASLDFATRNATGVSGATIQSDFDTYLFVLLNVLPATSAADLWMRVGTGGTPTWDEGANYTWANYQYSQIPNGANLGAAAAAQIKIGHSLANTSTKGASGKIELFNPLNTSVHKQFIGHLTGADSAGNYVGAQIGAIYLATTAVTAVRFLCSSGNIASGTIRVYGGAKSYEQHFADIVYGANITLSQVYT